MRALDSDVDVVLKNESGRVIATGQPNGNLDETIRRDLAAGTYYIHIQTNDNDSHSYRLSASAHWLQGDAGRTLQSERNANEIIRDWNATLLDAIRVDRTAPPKAARSLAIVHTAIYDAVNSILNFGESYHTKIKAPRRASAEAAAAGAAYQTLVTLFPAQKLTFEAALATSLTEIAEGDRREQAGFRVGVQVANQILAWRSQDGSTAIVPYTPVHGRGFWQPTPGGSTTPVLPHWPNVTPFAMQSGSQFRPAGPPTVDNPEFAAEIDLVRRMGGKVSTERTIEQTDIAFFWADGAGTFTPPGHWNQITQQIAQANRTSLSEDARLFAMLNIALADAGIAAWDAKYAVNQARPVTMIQAEYDPTWLPLLTTPSFPDYISGHSTFSAAASEVLSCFFGRTVPFSTTADPKSAVAGVMRSYSSVAEAANEAGLSRIYGGIHVPCANQDGLKTGIKIGRYVVKKFLTV
jgi:hypothetical protein